MTETIEKVSCNVRRPIEFILGGNAEFTISNIHNKIHYEYRIRKSKDKNNLFFIWYKESIEAWKYAGYFTANGCMIDYRKGKNGNLDVTSPIIKGIFYAMRHFEELPYPMQMTHHGKCACCGKKLMDEESVIRGFGPTCWKRVESYRNA